MLFLAGAMLLDCLFSTLLVNDYDEANPLGIILFRWGGFWGYLLGKAVFFGAILMIWKRFRCRAVEAAVLISTGIHLATVILMGHLWVAERLEVWKW